LIHADAIGEAHVNTIRACWGTAAAAFDRWSPRLRRGWTWTRGVNVRLAIAASVGATLLTVSLVHHLYVDRRNLPDLGPFTRFELSTIGHIYDTSGQPLIQLAWESRQIAQYADIPPIVRDAILATEDKRFFSHNGVDYLSIPRVLAKVRVGGPVMFPQGGSTITQQLVRGVFLRGQASGAPADQRRSPRFLFRVLSSAIGERNAMMVLRKREEIRLTLWVEQEMRERFGSKRRAKEEIFARYASFVYMGDGQYGFARAAEHYVGRPLSTFTANDADKAALLAGIMKAPRDYAPTATDTGRILSRRNQILALMAARGFIARAEMAGAARRPLPAVVPRASEPFRSSAVVAHVLDELTAGEAGLDIHDLLHGRVQVYTTVDARVQRLASDALERGLERYEERHPGARGVVQGAVVVLQNRDGRILAETGGRQVFNGRPASYSDYNRVTRSLRQPGSAMKPIVYLAAFERGDFTLETLVPDEPIGVPDGDARPLKWISNYDGLFKGPIPIRQALAESRNAAAMWLAGQIGIDPVLQTSQTLGVGTPLEPYPATALGASDMNLLELANAYRTMASGLVAEPYLIRAILRDSGEMLPVARPAPPRRASIDAAALALIQEGLRGVVRLPNGTAHALASRGFPIAVMGKTGTTSEFRDAIFVGSTYGPDGMTAAVRIGFDDNRSLGPRETGGRVALPVFQELMLGVYGDAVLGKAPAFPSGMEASITASLLPPDPPPVIDVTSTAAGGEEGVRLADRR
jgi:penicillin-binding protein 1A